MRRALYSKLVCCVLAVASPAAPALAQELREPTSGSAGTALRDYDLAAPDNTPADFLTALALVPAVNLSYWLPAKFVIKDYFADISLETMRGNIRHGWVFDDDLFVINQFGHPYQGNSYFGVARSFGLSFWQSAPYALLGSLQWEYLMESGSACCYPSVNDLVTTTIGGIAVGEVLWRLSRSLLDESTSGSERFWRELGAFAINPPHGLYRLASGDAFASGSAPLRPHAVFGETSVGASLFGSGVLDDFAIIPRFRLRHGRIPELAQSFAPFDHFSVDLALGIARRGMVGATFDVSGVVAGAKLDLCGAKNALVGAAIDFDFFDNVLASLGLSSVGGVFAAEFSLSHELTLFTRAALLGGVGAVTSAYPDIRHYNLGFGAALRTWVELRHPAWGELYLKADRYWIHTWSGAPGDELAGVLDAGGTYALTADVGLGFHYLLADKSGYYHALADTSETLHLGEGYLAWRF